MSGRVDVETIKLASSALLSWHKKQKAGANPLIESPESIQLQFCLKRVPGNPSNKPKLIPIPHSLHHSEDRTGDLCLIVKDPAKPFKEQLAARPVDGFTRVIGLSKLKKKFGQYQERRELAASFDAFFADDRVLPSLSKALGKAFFTKKKQPVPVKVTGSGMNARLARARDATCFYMPFGSCAGVRIGTTLFSAAELAANITAAVDVVVEHIPKKWANIQHIFLRTDDSVPLPLYTSDDAAAGAAAGGAGSVAAGDVSSDSDSDSCDEDEDEEVDVPLPVAKTLGKAAAKAPAPAPAKSSSKSAPLSKAVASKALATKADAPAPAPAPAAVLKAGVSAKPTAKVASAQASALPSKPAKPTAAGKPAPVAAAVPSSAAAVAKPKAKPVSAAASAAAPAKTVPTPSAAPAKPAAKQAASASTTKIAAPAAVKPVAPAAAPVAPASAPADKKRKAAPVPVVPAAAAASAVAVAPAAKPVKKMRK